MINVKILGSDEACYEDEDKRYGDCIIIDNGTEVLVFDCGSEEHAKRVIKYLDERGIDKVKLILSHDDSDHFDGIPYLIEQGRVSKIYTLLLLKYKDEILKIIGDGRKTDESITKAILDMYSNVATLTGQDLNNIEVGLKLADGIEIVGPNKDYMLNAASIGLNTLEGDTVDKESIYNAISAQVSVDTGNGKLLLCGDASFKAIEDIVQEYKIVQLPHHRKRGSSQTNI